MSSFPLITVFPTPKGEKISAQNFWRSSDRVIPTDSAHAAILQAFRAIPNPARGRALVPVYHCGVEIQAVIDAGWDVEFYRVGWDLAVDYNDLAARMRVRPGPVLLIHYFGFAQPS